jgi:carbamoyltransferase
MDKTRMRHCGFSEYFHDAGIAFVEDGNIEFATHAERYSKIKNDPRLPSELTSMIKDTDHVTFYEDYSIRKKYETGFTEKELSSHGMRGADSLVYDSFIPHHVSHAACGYYTRPWTSKEDTVILTIDGAGEYQTSCIYDHNFNLLSEEVMPRSVGYFYTFTTRYLGLRPLEDEYVVMGLAAYGKPVIGEEMVKFYNQLECPSTQNIRFSTREQIYGFLKTLYKGHSDSDVAASCQYFAEIEILNRAREARKYGSKLVYAGGCAQNVVANSMIKPLFDDMHIPVAPTDAGSALGAAAYSYGKELNWNGPYLGYNIERDIDPKEVVRHLLRHRYCGVANGRAEYGPRALGNRSLIADVRFDVKGTVNKVKQRQKYRPFGPAILEEFVDQYFEGPMNEYMQYACNAKHDFKSVTHVDGTARVQVVKPSCTSIFRKILEEFYEQTGVPMLLNTSLNIRGRPIVNDEKDAKIFQNKYGVKVF